MENATQQKILMPQDRKDDKPAVEERPGIVEAILYISGDAVDKAEICKAMNLTDEELAEALTSLESTYNFERRGLRLLQFGTHVQLTTRPDYAPYVERLLQPVQRQSLSQAIMETLAVIAYKQPVTKAEVEQIRGVKCDYSIQSLVSKGLIVEAGRKEALGRPILYGTTDAFLRHFCISSLDDLPEIDFSKLAKQAAENGESEDSGETFEIGTTHGESQTAGGIEFTIEPSSAPEPESEAATEDEVVEVVQEEEFVSRDEEEDKTDPAVARSETEAGATGFISGPEHEIDLSFAGEEDQFEAE